VPAAVEEIAAEIVEGAAVVGAGEGVTEHRGVIQVRDGGLSFASLSCQKSHQVVPRETCFP
jgi:hypothetical protein